MVQPIFVAYIIFSLTFLWCRNKTRTTFFSPIFAEKQAPLLARNFRLQSK